MDFSRQNLGQDERAGLRLRALFEARGFRRVRVQKFEEYSLYMDNKNFLDTESMITFMDLDGKLLALKPDVTLSVVKNIPSAPLATAQKLYYQDEVYRLSRENREYKVRQQIGVEWIGPEDALANLEIVDLALQSLASLSARYLLDISHLGFVGGLLAEMELSHSLEKQVLAYIHAKNSYDLCRVLNEVGVCEQACAGIKALAEIHGGFVESLEQARGLIANEQMRQAFAELSELAAMLQQRGLTGHVNLDFSVVNDLDYYNGLILRGYLEEVPLLVLTGGRYDNMMRKMGKGSSAVGFAIALDALQTYLKSGRRYDFDILLTYEDGCDYAALLAYQAELMAAGQSVRLERESQALAQSGLRYREQVKFGEVGAC